MKSSMISWLFFLFLSSNIPESYQQDILHERRSTLVFKGPKGPSAFYFYPEQSESVDEESSFRMPSLSDDNNVKQNTKRSFTPLVHQKLHKRTKEYVRKHINHPMKLFRRVLKILKKDSKRSTQMNPPKYFLIPSDLFKKKNSKIKRFIRNGKRHTDIDTRRYHVSIMEKAEHKKKNRISNSTTHSSHIAIRRRSEFFPSYEDNYPQSNTYQQSFDGNKKTIENQMLSVVLKKLHNQKSQLTSYNNRDKMTSENHSNTGRLVMDAVQNLNNEQKELIEDITKRQEKKKRLTNLFVRFMEDLTHKLNLDPLTIADMLVKRTTEKRSRVAYTK